MNLSYLNEVFDSINEDTSNGSNFDFGFIENLPIKRGDLQQCSGNRWFWAEMINLAFKNLQFRNKNVIYLRSEVVEEIQVKMLKNS